MPKIRQTSPEEKNEVRATLSDKKKAIFDALAELIASPRIDSELDWQHQIGTCLADSRRDEDNTGPGSKWFLRLATALGPSPSLLRRAHYFKDKYPGEKDVQELKDMGVEWTRLYIALPIVDKTKRHNLLKKAVKEAWTITRCRVEVQKLVKSKRRGVGGPKHRTHESLGAEYTLRGVTSRSQAWIKFHDQAWAVVDDSEWEDQLHVHRGAVLLGVLDRLVHVGGSAVRASIAWR